MLASKSLRFINKPTLLRSLTTQRVLHPLSDFVHTRLTSPLHSPFIHNYFNGVDFSIKNDGCIELKSSSHGIQINTVYDKERNVHLLVTKYKIHDKVNVGEYVLQNNNDPAWHTSKISVEEKIHVAVDGMVEFLSDAFKE
jgi:hypothetical protein